MNELVTSVPSRRAVGSFSARSGLATFARAHRRELTLVLASIGYLGFACYLTWPLVTHLSHSIYGAPGDPYGTMAFFSELVNHHYNPFLPGTISQVAAPTGIPIPWPRDLASAPEIYTLYGLTALFGAIPAYGLYTLAGYTLTGLVTFLFVRRLTGSTWAALIAGWAFAFYPFAAINGQGHLDFVHGWVLMLAVWRMLELLWQPTRRNGLWAGLAVALSMWWSPYFILFGGVTYAAGTAVAMLLAWREGRVRSILVPQLIAASIVLVFMAGLGALAIAGGGEGIGARTHTKPELEEYGARPPEYVLPDVQSPLLGSATRSFLRKYPLGGAGIESTLYVGVTVILLALVAFAAFLRRKLAPRPAKAVPVLWGIALAAAITSMSPEARIFGVWIPLPSHFIAEVSSTWRVYSRFVIIVMLALTALAAIGLGALIRGRPSWVKLAVMSLATIAIPLDLWAPQHGHVYRITTPGIYQTLARLPMGLVAEYPLSDSGVDLYKDVFFENAYGKPMINGYEEESAQERLAFSVDLLHSPATAARLATLGVRYVLVNAKPRSWGWPPSGTPGAGFRLIAHEPHANLYIVTARPRSPALAAAGTGFGETEYTHAGTVSLLERPSGMVALVGTCTSCNGVLSMTLASYAQPHKVTIRTEHGRVLRRETIDSAVRMSLPLHFSKHATVEVSATPAPQQLAKAEGSPSASIEISNPEFVGDTR
jgi:hypothetical protein